MSSKGKRAIGWLALTSMTLSLSFWWKLWFWIRNRSPAKTSSMSGILRYCSPPTPWVFSLDTTTENEPRLVNSGEMVTEFWLFNNRLTAPDLAVKVRGSPARLSLRISTVNFLRICHVKSERKQQLSNMIDTFAYQRPWIWKEYILVWIWFPTLCALTETSLNRAED